MNKLLLDTNVVIVLLADKTKFIAETQELFTLAKKNKVQLFITSLIFEKINIILAKSFKNEKSKNILKIINTLIEVLPINNRIINSVKKSKFSDYKAAIQYYTAIDNEIGGIITKSTCNYKLSIIPVCTIKDYLHYTQNN